jgi:hypothetical protein
VRTDHLVTVQHAFERADCVSQDWHVERTSIPERVLETVGTLDTIPAGEAKGDVVLPHAEKTNAKAASGKNRAATGRDGMRAMFEMFPRTGGATNGRRQTREEFFR